MRHLPPESATRRAEGAKSDVERLLGTVALILSALRRDVSAALGVPENKLPPIFDPTGETTNGHTPTSMSGWLNALGPMMEEPK